MPNHIRDLTGQIFNSLSVMWPIGKTGSRRNKTSRIHWLCACSCGSYTTVAGSDIVRGRTKSCGCERLSEDAAYRALFAQYKNKAQQRDFVWEIEFEHFKQLVTSPCYYTGRPPSQLFRARNKKVARILSYNGIDRVDNTRGYIAGNVVPCHGTVNKAKLTMTEKDFINMCRQVSKQHPEEVVNGGR